ncbi:MAG TPA: hypothetical protein VFQ37_00805, partial [Mycobacterium sp.]|nr:hypothetical protein [Mycobacterium sp.]
MAIAYDATSAGLASSNVSGSGAGFTLAHTAASGADVFLAVEVDYTGTPSAAQYNGTNLTLLAAPFANNGSYGSVSLYHGPGLGTGSSENFSFTIPPTSYFVAGSVSYTGVGSVGTATTTYGSSTSASTGSISCSAGQMIVAAIGMGTYNDGASKTISST